MKRTLLLLILAAMSGRTSLQAQQPNPFLGTWKFNPAKSQLNGTRTQSRVDRYEPFGKDGITLISETTDSKGVTSNMSYSAEFDGKDYPMTGSPNTDAVALERLSAYAFTSYTKKNGKLADYVRRFVTKDGKTMIMTSGGGLWLFDKQ